jgi:glutamine amidotransferase
MTCPNKNYLSIVDYGMGNLFSITNICKYAGIEAVKTSEKSVIENSLAVILPGVGAFKDAMFALKKLALIDVLINAVNNGKPFLGICLGMQLLMSESEEFGNNKGLNIIEGRVIRFPNLDSRNNKIRVPHIGWSKIYRPQNFAGNCPLLNNIRDNDLMYFVHSYFVVPKNKDIVVTYSEYCGVRFCSGIQKGNLFAFQFHPEKSGFVGIQIFKNLKEIMCKNA